MPVILRWPFLEAVEEPCCKCVVIRVPAGALLQSLGGAVTLATRFNAWRRHDFLKRYPKDIYQLDHGVLKECGLPIAQYDLSLPPPIEPPEHFKAIFAAAAHGIEARRLRRFHGPHCLCFEDGAGTRGYAKVHSAQHNLC